jgi:hypothetical protein
MVGSMSICTARALPSSGRNSAYGKPVPIISSVSQCVIMSQLALVPRMPIEPVTQGRSSGRAALPSRALAAPACRRSATAITSSVAPQRAGADQDRHLLAGVQDLGRARRSASWARPRLAVADAGEHRAVLARRVFIGLFLQIVGQHQHADAVAAEDGAHRAVDQVPHLRGTAASCT